MPDDLEALVAVAAAAGSPDATASHLEHVASAGRLLVADGDEGPVGLAGSLPIGAATFVSDLFVAPRWHGRGIGGLLVAALLVGDGPFVTFSSQHPAALRLYGRHGMERRGDVLYLERDGRVRHVLSDSATSSRLIADGWSAVDADVVMASPGWAWPDALEEVSPGRFWPNGG